MGFYSDKQPTRRGGKLRLPKWMAIVGLSAFTGSAVTYALTPAVKGNALPGAAMITTSVSSLVAGKVSHGQPGTNGDGTRKALPSIPTAAHAGITAVTKNSSNAPDLRPTVSGEGDSAIPAMAYAGTPTDVTYAVKRVEPAVMGVVNYSQVSDFFTQQTKLEATGVGTGVLFYKNDKAGYAVTNNHVVAGAARVEVVLESGKHIAARVVGTDPYTDLAVLQIPLQVVHKIQPITFANSDTISVGEPAIAIGTPMGLDFADSVTAGIVSAKKRIMPVEQEQMQQVLDYQAVIQTDAAINPGNSGGPLVNIRGEVIGINSSKIVAPSFEGMGFAIPSNEVKSIASQIMQSGHATHPALGINGVSLASLPEEMWPSVPVDYGVWIQKISSEEAVKAGLQPEDVIVAIDKHDIRNMADLRTYLFQLKPGQTVKLRVYRDSKRLTLSVPVGQMSATVSAPATSTSDSGGAPFSIPNWFGDFFGN